MSKFLPLSYLKEALELLEVFSVSETETMLRQQYRLSYDEARRIINAASVLDDPILSIGMTDDELDELLDHYGIKPLRQLD